MSRICLHCHENETPDGHNKICDACFDNAGNWIEQNVVMIEAGPKLLKALKHALRRLNEIPHKYDKTDFRLIESAIAEAEGGDPP
jgi:hypothetical protein